MPIASNEWMNVKAWELSCGEENKKKLIRFYFSALPEVIVVSVSTWININSVWKLISFWVLVRELFTSSYGEYKSRENGHTQDNIKMKSENFN